MLRVYGRNFIDTTNWMKSGVIISREMDDGLDRDFYSFEDLAEFKRESLELATKKEEERIKVLKEVFAKKKVGLAPASPKKSEAKIENLSSEEELGAEKLKESQEKVNLDLEKDLPAISGKQIELLDKINGLELAKEHDDIRRGLKEELSNIFKLVNQTSRGVKRGLMNWETEKIVIEKRLSSLDGKIADAKKKYSKTIIESNDENNEGKKLNQEKNKLNEAPKTPRRLNIHQVLSDQEKLKKLLKKK